MYTNDKESTPVDGLLPLLRLKRNNRHRFGKLGAVISFSFCGDASYYFWIIGNAAQSLCVRCVVRFFARLHRNSAGILDVWQGISGQYGGKSASRLRTKPAGGLCAVLPKVNVQDHASQIQQKAADF